MKKNNDNLLEGAIAPALVRFSIPVILSMLTAQLYTVVDSMIIGRFLDADALAAVSNAGTVIMVFLFLSGGMELGCGLLVAAKKPVSDEQEMSKIFYNLLFIDVVLAALMTVAGLSCFGFFLNLIQTPAEIMEQAMLYGKIYMLFLPCQMVYDVSRQLVIGVGESASPMRMVILTTFLNVVLDLAMVPFWGITGAVVATGIAEFVGLVLVWIRLRKQYLLGHFHMSLLSAEYGKEILRLAPPNALQQASGTVVTLVKQGLLGGFGAMAIAGFSCATKTITFMMMPIFGFAQALVVFYAQNLVAGNRERVAKAKRLSYLVAAGYVCIVAAVSFLFSRPLMAMFTTETEAIRYGVLILTFEPLGQFLYGLRVMNEAQLRGRRQMGRFLLSSVGTMALNILCCLILVNKLGFSGFYIAGYISNALGLILSGYLAAYKQ